MTILLAVSLPLHPTTGNVFRAPAEAAALAMVRALNLPIEIVHVSEDAVAEDLRPFAGYGATVTLLHASDPLGALHRYAVERAARLVLMGRESALGIGSGMLPYALAARLGWPLVPDIRDLEPAGEGWCMTAALAHGHGVAWTSKGPAVATVTRGPTLGLPSFSKARHEKIAFKRIETKAKPKPKLVPSTPRPAPIAAPATGDYATRLRSHLSPDTAGGGQAREGQAEELATHFLAELRRLGFHPGA